MAANSALIYLSYFHVTEIHHSVGSEVQNLARGKRRKTPLPTPLQCHPRPRRAPAKGLDGARCPLGCCRQKRFAPEVLGTGSAVTFRAGCSPQTRPNTCLRARGPGGHAAKTRHCVLSVELVSPLMKTSPTDPSPSPQQTSPSRRAVLCLLDLNRNENSLEIMSNTERTAA